MNSSSTPESGPYSTNQRPFFYARATAQQPFPNPWFLGPMYNPYSMPTTGFRSGNPYYPFYSIPFHEYSGYLVQQPPMHMRVNRRPYFNGHPPSSPMFYQATRFRHYSPGKRTETKETQTDPKQLESKQKKHQDHAIETKDRDAANVTCFPSVGKGAESCMEKSDQTVSPTILEREFAKSSAGSVQFRSLPPPGYAFEKEEVRIEYGNGGTPAIQLWKSFKETIPLYDVAKKAVPENIMQRDVFALSACEGVIYGRPEQNEMVPGVPYSEEQKALVDVQEKEQLSRASLDSEKDGAASHRAKSPLDETKSAQLAEPTRLVAEPHQLGLRQDAQMPKKSLGFKRSSGPKVPQDVSNLVQQREYFPSGMEITNDSSFPQKLAENDEMTNDHQVRAESLWCDESEKFIPPDSWLACLDNMDANYNYNMYLSQRKRPSVLSLTSDEMSSVDEASVTDKTPVSYFAPDFMLQKNMYMFKKSPEGLERERIKSGGSLNEDEMVGSEQPYTSNSHSKSCSRVKIKDISSHGRKLGLLPRSSAKKLYSRKASKSLSPSEAEESDEYWVKEQEEEEEDDDEEEYLIQGVAPYGTLSPSKSSLYRQIGQQVFWRIPKNAVPAQLISWPVQEKIKTSSPTKLKGQEQDDLCGDYSFCLKRPTVQLEVLEHRKTPHKLLGRLQKEDGEVAADEYWMKSGARPKFTTVKHGGLLPLTKRREKDNLLVDMSKKGARKPPHKRRDTRHDAEELEEWEKPKTTQHKARGPKRSLYKRR